MTQQVLIPPNFSGKYLVIAIATCISLHANAETLNKTLIIANDSVVPQTSKDSELKVSENNNPEVQEMLFQAAKFEQNQFHESQLQYSSKVRALSPPTKMRMGEWLNGALDTDQQGYYESALVWQSNNEIKPQQTKLETLIETLESLAKTDKNLQPLLDWMKALPATGRVILPKQDLRYLQANPSIEPIIDQNDTVIVHQRPNTVTVLFDDTQACKVVYEAGVRAKDYIDACSAHFSKEALADDAYLILPDGTVQFITLAKWNAKQQLTPSAGAWLWVPSTKHRWSDNVPLDIANFLATQGIDMPLPHGQSERPITLSNRQSEEARDLPVHPSDWGITGLMQTPSARMQKTGTLGAHIAHIDPYTQYNLVLQPFEWLETAVRYTNNADVAYGSVSPDQDLKDKSLDVKIRLLKEQRWLPELAVGWRDPAGTSLFGGEYVVANKRYGDFDFSLGMGWGYLGARQNIENPLTHLDDRFEKRVADKSGQGGELSPKSWFTGPSSLFGGVQWHTPYDPLTIKVEYDGNDYKSEPYSNKNLNTKDIPINVGMTWQYKNQGLAFNAGYERGDTMMLGFTMKGDLIELGQVKPKAEQVQYQDKRDSSAYSGFKYRLDIGGNDSSLTKNAPLLNAISDATGWRATDISFVNNQAIVNVENYDGTFINERLQQGMKILHKILPPNTTDVKIQILRHGEAVGVLNIDPKSWAQQSQQLLPPSERIEQPFTVNDLMPHSNTANTTVVAQSKLPRGSLSVSPSLKQSIGGPDGYLYGLYANANLDYRLWRGSWLNAGAQLRLVDNFDQFSYIADSKLPRVRTNIGKYMTTSRVLMPNLQWSQFKSLGNHWYGLAYAGYLEPMYAGVGGEIMYRQPNKSWAIGVDANRVRQRDFDQHFGMQDYEVTTGNVSLYWDTPVYDIDMKLSAGQYLAGDKGATLDLSRGFDNGVKMGGWITKTDVSAEEFGEGSMDKGIYVSIPFDSLFKPWASGTSQLVYQPLIRDGGAKLNRKYSLYDLTSPLDSSLLDITNPMAESYE